MKTSKRNTQPVVSRKLIALAAIGLLCSVMSAVAQEVSAHHHADSESSIAQTNTQQKQDWARAQLAKSPRHQEWVDVKYGNRTVKSFVVYPQVKQKATAVIVIHEIFGMSDWVQALTDEVAEAGYIAIAPDLLSGMGPNGGGTEELAASNSVGQAIAKLPPDQITSDLNAVADYVSKLPAANGKVAVTGYCWGGGQSFRFATNRPGIKAAFVFYGPPPTVANGNDIDKDALARIKAPVYGFYAGTDMRIGATVPQTIEAMKELKKFFDPVTYEGAGHGFMRLGEPNNPEPKPPVEKGDAAADKKAADDYQKALTDYKANRKARDEAWIKWKAILAKL
ncbi:MAG: carboxymethylenebutenolidase [Blastocatellia bacterium]|jgi:carboxymethylenebutenolidase|nr:carboxymethylenebutenolidase [Blastocatellia bacterium]